MPEIDYEVALDGTYMEWIRVPFSTTGGRVVTFMVQYETPLEGRRCAVVRFDNAHGFPHRDLLNRRGQVIEKRRMANDPEPGIALTLGERDIRANWPHDRMRFLEGEQ